MTSPQRRFQRIASFSVRTIDPLVLTFWQLEGL